MLTRPLPGSFTALASRHAVVSLFNWQGGVRAHGRGGGRCEHVDNALVKLSVFSRQHGLGTNASSHHHSTPYLCLSQPRSLRLLLSLLQWVGRLRSPHPCCRMMHPLPLSQVCMQGEGRTSSVGWLGFACCGVLCTALNLCVVMSVCNHGPLERSPPWCCGCMSGVVVMLHVRLSLSQSAYGVLQQ